MNEPLTKLASLIQAYLFAEGGALPIKRLVQLTGTESGIVHAAIEELSKHLEGSGLSVVKTDTEVTLTVSNAESEALRANYEKELGREIGDAGLEVLAIILYRGPSTRAEIDYIRGVNTTSTVRTLLARGLITRAGNPLDGREYVYRPTVELLAHMGIKSMEELPEYGTICNELKAFEPEKGPFNLEHERNNTDTAGGGVTATGSAPGDTDRSSDPS